MGLSINLVLFMTLVTFTNCSDHNYISPACLKNRAIDANYIPLGEIKEIGNISVYEYASEENKNKTGMLIGVYDIYGFAYSNIMQVVDQLSIQQRGFRAILPDFFRNDAWDPNSGNNMTEWMDRVGDWNTIVKPDLINLVRHYQSEGVTNFGIFGFCWGGRVATDASIELSDTFKASGLIHPSRVTMDDAENVKVPMYLMPSNGEFNMTLFYEVLQENFGDNCGHKRFDDMSHGFAGARGNFSDPLIQERVNEVITTLGQFFDKNLYSASISSGLQAGYMLITSLFISVFVISQT